MQQWESAESNGGLRECDCRVLMAQWSLAAWKALCVRQQESGYITRLFAKTGNGMGVNGAVRPVNDMGEPDGDTMVTDHIQLEGTNEEMMKKLRAGIMLDPQIRHRSRSECLGDLLVGDNKEDEGTLKALCGDIRCTAGGTKKQLIKRVVDTGWHKGARLVYLSLFYR